MSVMRRRHVRKEVVGIDGCLTPRFLATVFRVGSPRRVSLSKTRSSEMAKRQPILG
jgi:hypothetical protein